ncbi:MAG: hypothetical protein AAGC80_15940 [Rhodococcus sp. (in: high G+C Gram-positive bacteria)]
MASILALISAVLIALGRRSVRGMDAEIVVGVEGIAMRILPSSSWMWAVASGREVLYATTHMCDLIHTQLCYAPRRIASTGHHTRRPRHHSWRLSTAMRAFALR